MIWIVLSFVFLFVVYNYFRNYRRNELSKYVNGPTPLPIIGNVLLYWNAKPEETIEFIQHFINTYGKIFRIWVFSRLAFFTTDPKHIEIILSSSKLIDKNDLYNMLLPWLGTGLLISSGEKWFTHRRIITPSFHFKILEQFCETFDKHSRILMDQLQPVANEKSFNVYPYVTLCALDIISESAMGTEVNAQLNKESKYCKAVGDITFIIMTRFIKIWTRNDMLFSLFSPLKKRQDHAIRIMHEFTKDVITKRRVILQEELKKETTQLQHDDNDIGLKKKSCFLDGLLQATIDGQSLSNEEIREEVDTFMFEGHDTTTSALTFLLYSLSHHKDIQDKLYKEIIDESEQDLDGIADYKFLMSLKYMDLVIKETLRMYPPVPIIGRRFTEEVNLNGIILPKGSNISIGVFSMMRDPDNFPEPNTFNPDRFSVADSEAKNPYAYIPFSAGARNCIGQKFALLEIKSIVSRILRNFEILPGDKEPKLMINIILRSINGIEISLKKRENSI